MAKILVTGGAGYVGSACCARLLEKGHQVEVVDDLSTGHADCVPKGVLFHRADIGESDAISLILSGSAFDVIFHFAAKAIVVESVSDPKSYFETNVTKSLVMMEAMRAYGVKNLVLSSTAATYGNPVRTPIEEDDAKFPVNPYGETKLMLERMLAAYAKAYGWSVMALRYFNACGADKDWGERHNPETHVIPLLMQSASGRRGAFNIYGTDYSTPDGTCLRDYIHVLDIAEAHILGLQKMGTPGFSAYNIGTGKSHSVKELITTAEKVTGKKIPVQIAARRDGDPAELCASPQKLMKEFGWKPAHSRLEDVLAGAWKWEQRLSASQ